MVPVGEHYRPARSVDLNLLGVALTAGLVAAALAGGVVCLWEESPIPTLLILTPILQGLAIGAVLVMIVKWATLRTPWAALAVGIVSGAVSVGIVHYGHYLRATRSVRVALTQRIREEPSLSEAEKREAIARVEADPAAALDGVVLIDQTGSGGFLGFMKWRAKEGETIKSAKVAGEALWVVWGLEALIVMGAAGVMAAGQASEPFCEDCKGWCGVVRVPLWLRPDRAGELAAAVRSGSAEQVRDLPRDPDWNVGSGSAAVKTQECAVCRQTFADVVRRVPKGKGFEEKKLVRLLRVSPEMVQAMRDPQPAAPVPAPA